MKRRILSYRNTPASQALPPLLRPNALGCGKAPLARPQVLEVCCTEECHLVIGLPNLVSMHFFVPKRPIYFVLK